MSSICPLYNIEVQSELDLNQQPTLNSDYAHKYIVTNLGASPHTVTAADMGKLLIYSAPLTLTLNNDIAGVQIGDSFLVSCSTTVTITGTATKVNSYTENLVSAIVYQFIYISTNTWLYLPLN